MVRKLTRLVCILSLLLTGVPWAVSSCVHEDGFVHTITNTTLENHSCHEVSCESSELEADGFGCQEGHQCEDFISGLSSDLVYTSGAFREVLPRPTVFIAQWSNRSNLPQPSSCVLSANSSRAPPGYVASVHLSIAITVLRI